MTDHRNPVGPVGPVGQDAPAAAAAPVEDMLTLAIGHHQAGRVREAQALYESVLAVAPDHADALHLSGVAAHQLGATDRAIARLQRALAVNPGFAEAQNSLGNVLKQAGRTAEAEACYRQAILLQPDYAEPHNNLGSLLQAGGQPEEAEACYRRALACLPDYVEAWYNLGIVLAAGARPEEAEACFRRALALRPDFAAAHNNLGSLLRGGARPEEAEACYRAALALTPDDAEIHYNLAATLLARNLPEAAEACYRRALALDPGLVRAHHDLGMVLNGLGRSEEAIACLRRAFDLDPGNAAVQFQLGTVLQAQGEIATAEECYRRALAIDGGSVAARVNLGNLFRLRGRAEEAVICYQRALAEDPNLAAAHNNLGIIRKEQERLEEAIGHLQRALELAPDMLEALTNLGDVFRQLDRLEEAEDCLRKVVARRPEIAEAHNNLGLVLFARERLDEAEACYRQALELRPGYPAAESNIADIRRRQGRLDEAEAGYRRALAGDPQLATAYCNLGLLLHNRQRLDEAEACWQRALELQPDFALVHWNRSLMLLGKGELARGWEGYDCGLAAKIRQPNRPFTVPRWQGEDLAGRRVLVWREQGVGDELLFASCFPDLIARAGSCIIECSPRLVRLFARSFPQATVRADSYRPGAAADAAPDFDLHVPAGSLPRYLRADLPMFPDRPAYLAADPARIAFWKERLDALGPGLKVGLCWRSKVKLPARSAFYTRPEEWGEILTVPGVHFVSLQYGDSEEEIRAAEQRFGVPIHRWPDIDLLDDFDDVAALDSALDIMMAPDTAAGALAGALGVPVWKLCFTGDWTAFGTDRYPLQPSVRLFAKPPDDPWDDVLRRLAAELRRAAAARAAGLLPARPAAAGGERGEVRFIPWPVLLLSTAAQHHKAGRLAQAEARYREVLESRPDEPTALHLLGVLAHQTNRNGLAVELIGRAVALKPDYAAAHTNLGVALVAQGEDDRAEACFRRALALRPDDAEALTNLGVVHDRRGAIDEAEACFRRAMALKPDLAAAETGLGNVFYRRGQIEEAMACHHHALAINPDLADAHLNLGVVLWVQGRAAEAEASYRRALALRPNLVEAYANLAPVLQQRGRAAEAEECCRKALALAPGNPLALWNRSLLLLGRGELATGWEGYDWRFTASSFSVPLRRFPVPRWQGEALAGRRILVWREQGVGDELLFASCYPDLIARAGSCIIECDPRLVRLFARSFPQAAVRAEPRGAAPPAPPDFDLHVPAGSLPRFFRGSIAQFPARARYLAADPQRVDFWRERLDALGPGLKVGLCWRGRRAEEPGRVPLYTRLDEWGPVLTIPGVHFVSLQYGDSEEEIRAAEQRFGVPIRRWPDVDLLDDFDDVAALDTALDLTITPGTTAGALAGALGRPVWKFLIRGDWITLGTDGYPWQPTTRLFLREPEESWDGVLQQIGRDLRAAVAAADGRGAAARPQAAAPADDGWVDGFLAAAVEHHRAGRLYEAERLYRKILDARPDNPDALHLLGVVAHQSGRHDDAIALIGLALARDPGFAQAHNNLGRALLAAGRPAEAEASYRQALALKPDYAEALNNLANALQDLDRPAEAEACYRRALALRPDYAEAHSNLGNALLALGQFEAAAAAHRQALALKPDYADGHGNLGTVLQTQGRIAEAEACYRQALALAPGHAMVRWNHSLILLAQGDLAAGWEAYDWRFRGGLRRQNRRFPVPQWQGEALAGRRILVWREQGIGDELLFASCYPDLIARAGSCIIECDPRLAGLFARSFPQATVRAEPPDRGLAVVLPDFDLHVPAGSLPRYFRDDLARFPDRPGYLTADPARIAVWRQRLAALGTGPKIGICWRGRQAEDPVRAPLYTRLGEWGPVLTAPGIRFVSLQYGECEEEIRAAERQFGMTIHRWPELVDLMNDFDAVAALDSALDLVIAPGTAAGALAGALGRPVWVLTLAGTWLALGSDRHPWFPSARLFIRPPGETWQVTLRQVGRALGGVHPLTGN